MCGPASRASLPFFQRERGGGLKGEWGVKTGDRRGGGGGERCFSPLWAEVFVRACEIILKCYCLLDANEVTTTLITASLELWLYIHQGYWSPSTSTVWLLTVYIKFKWRPPHYPLAYWLLFMDRWLCWRCCIDFPFILAAGTCGRSAAARACTLRLRRRIWWNDQAESFVSRGKRSVSWAKAERERGVGWGVRWWRLRRVSEISPTVLCNTKRRIVRCRKVSIKVSRVGQVGRKTRMSWGLQRTNWNGYFSGGWVLRHGPGSISSRYFSTFRQYFGFSDYYAL